MALLSKQISIFSIKWKISFVLIAMGLLFVGSFVFMVRNVLESDKILNVFENQSSHLESIRGNIEAQFSRAFLVSKSVIATLDQERGQITASGQELFQSEKNLIGLELWNEKQRKTVLRLEKQDSVLPPGGAKLSPPQIGTVQVDVLSRHQLLLSRRYNQGSLGVFRLSLVLDASRLLPPATPSLSFALGHAGEIAAVSDVRGISQLTFKDILKALESSDGGKNLRWPGKQGQSSYLVSQKKIDVGNLQILSLSAQSEALGALGSLFKRSLLFLSFSAFVLLFISLLLAKHLISRLGVLAEAASEIGAGNFDLKPKMNSSDEIGLVARSFGTMSEKFKQMLIDTKQATQNEERLKTVGLVREQLLPKMTSTQIDTMQICGVSQTAKDYSGDWWHYFVRGNNLYIAIADATGHGTAAALVCAATRAVFSRLEQEPLSLVEMLKAWDLAICSCTHGEGAMTGMLVKINTKTGQGSFLNAGHQVPYFFTEKQDLSFSYHTMDAPETSPYLGTRIQRRLEEVYFDLGPNCCLVLYTKGLFAVKRPDGKVLSEKRFGQSLAGHVAYAISAQEVTNMALKIFETFRSAQDLKTDVSVVTIRRQGPTMSIFLESETGQIGYLAQEQLDR